MRRAEYTHDVLLEISAAGRSVWGSTGMGAAAVTGAAVGGVAGFSVKAAATGSVTGTGVSCTAAGAIVVAGGGPGLLAASTGTATGSTGMAGGAITTGRAEGICAAGAGTTDCVAARLRRGALLLAAGSAAIAGWPRAGLDTTSPTARDDEQPMAPLQ